MPKLVVTRIAAVLCAAVSVNAACNLLPDLPDEAFDPADAGNDANDVNDAGGDAGNIVDDDAGAGIDGGALENDGGALAVDAGDPNNPPDPLVDAGVDAGTNAGVDAGSVDAGTDAGVGDPNGNENPNEVIDDRAACLAAPAINLAASRVGRFERLADFPMGNGLRARDVVVYLPVGYDPNSNRRYPVVYMHDGQNLFSDAEAAFGAEWGVDETIDMLTANNMIEPHIVVGIDNTPDRTDDYTPDVDPEYGGGNGPAYIDAVATRVKPYIDAHYQTRCERSATTLLGSSLGGLISCFAAQHRPASFGRVGCVSSSFWWNNGSLFESMQNFAGPLPLRLWIDAGTNEAGTNAALAGMDFVVADARVMRDLVRTKGLRFGQRLGYLEDTIGSEHNEPSWAVRLSSILTFLLSDQDFTEQQVTSIKPILSRPQIAVNALSAVNVEVTFASALGNPANPAQQIRMTVPNDEVQFQGINLETGQNQQNLVVLNNNGHLKGNARAGVEVVAQAFGTTGSSVLDVGGDGNSIPVVFYTAVPTNTTGQVFLAGGAPILGEWDAAGVGMSQQNNGLWRAAVRIPTSQGPSIEYKFTRGDWNFVEKGSNGEELGNRILTLDEPARVDETVLRWADQ